MSANTTSNQKSSKKGLLIAICAILIVALCGGIFVFATSSNSTSGYTQTSTSKETIETYYTFSGNVASTSTQTIMAESIIQIKEILVNEGDYVEADTAIFITSDDSEITSKISGTVNKIMVEVDQQVVSGAQLAEIMDFDNLQITVKIDEYDLDAVEIDKTIDVTIGALDKDIEGTISEISRTAATQNGVAYFTATVNLGYDKDVKVGMTAEAKILNEQSKDTVALPMKALSFDDDNNPFVYTNGDNGMNKVSVVVGINNGKTVEIKSGLSANQTVYYKNTASNAMAGFSSPFLNR